MISSTISVSVHAPSLSILPINSMRASPADLFRLSTRLVEAAELCPTEQPKLTTKIWLQKKMKDFCIVTNAASKIYAELHSTVGMMKVLVVYTTSPKDRTKPSSRSINVSKWVKTAVRLHASATAEVSMYRTVHDFQFDGE